VVRQRAGPEVHICAADGPRGPTAPQGRGFALPLSAGNCSAEGFSPSLYLVQPLGDVETRGHGLSKRDAKELVELFFEEIRRALENGEQVKLSGFGNFDLRDKNQRPGRNPKTGEDIPITARRVVTFRPGQKLKSRVENATPKEE